jgi:hypothetical protein
MLWLFLQMNFFRTAIAVFVTIAASCNNNTNADSQSNKPSGSDSTMRVADTSAAQPFFPVASFLRGEIQSVDSLPVGIMKYHTKGRKTDSAYIKSDEFHRLAAEFLSPAIADSVFKKNFTESSFIDRSTNSATFFYKAVDPNLPLQRIDIVTAKGDVYDEVKSVYMEKRDSNNNRLLNKKLFWRPKRNFQIISVSGDASSPDQSNVVKVVWDNRE